LNVSLKLGDKAIGFPYILAPMAGITNAPFRMLMREMGSGAVISELISATGLKYESKKTETLCDFFPEETPVGLQIFGDNAEHMAMASVELEKRGVDFIDINCGCPVPKVVDKGGGSAMLKDPEAFYKTMKTVKNAIRIPLTVKIRTGWDHNSKNADEIVAAAAEAGCSWVAIHGRTRSQAYEGEADWDFIAKIKSGAKIPIIGNGDVLTAAQAIERLNQSGCDGVMIGRGALRNPFIFQEIARLSDRRDLFRFDETTEELAYWKLLERHLELMQKMLSPYMTALLLRKFICWYSAGMDGAAKIRKAAFEIPMADETLDQVIALSRSFFERPNVRKSKSYLSEPFLKGGHG
jgi:tRNA-dihydrouridine synthase B